MDRHLSPRVIGITIAALVSAATPAFAETDTWVSGTGIDSGNCSRTAPCRTFAFALTTTNVGGTINVATPGNFGPVTIEKSVSIIAEGVEAVINSGNVAIYVRTSIGAVVSLRGLTIEGVGTGIAYDLAGTLHVQNCVIRNTETGIGFVSRAGSSELTVRDTLITNTFYGINIGNDRMVDRTTVILDRVRILHGSREGIRLQGREAPKTPIIATLRDSVVSGYATGVFAQVNGVTLMIDRSAVVNNGIGIRSQTGATIRVGETIVTGNLFGLKAGGGVIESYGTNKVRGNNTDTAGNITPIAYK